MELSFFKLSPGGNSTILVNAYEMPFVDRAQAANALMHPLHLQAEQTGFVNLHDSPPSLIMMGGEFCLNATRCLVLLMLRQGLFFPLAGTDDLFGLVRSSGMPEPLHVRIADGKNHAGASRAECFVSFHLSLSDGMFQTADGGMLLAHLPGITHLLVPGPAPADTDYEAAALRARFRLEACEACGVVWYVPVCQAEENTLAYSITLVVYVRETGSAVAETACGSATLALALAVVTERLHTSSAGSANGRQTVNVLQPSGCWMHARLAKSPDGKSVRAEVGGMVELQAEGTAFLRI